MLSDGKSLNAICKDTHSKHYDYTQFKSCLTTEKVYTILT